MVLEICSHSLQVFWGLWQKRQFWSPHCCSLLAWIKQFSLFFPLPPSLHWIPLSQIIFHSLTLNFETFLSSSRQGTLFFILTRTTFHIASSSGCNFGTRSLNRENSEVAYWKVSDSLQQMKEGCFRHHSLHLRRSFYGRSFRHCDDSLASLVVRYRFCLYHQDLPVVRMHQLFRWTPRLNSIWWLKG